MIIGDATGDIGFDTRGYNYNVGKFSSPMAAYLAIKNTEFADEWDGDHDFGQWASRFGKRILWSDFQGFTWVTRHASEAEAIAAYGAHVAALTAFLREAGDEDYCAAYPETHTHEFTIHGKCQGCGRESECDCPVHS